MRILLFICFVLASVTGFSQKATIRYDGNPIRCISEVDSMYTITARITVPAGHCPINKFTVSWGDGVKDEFSETLDYSRENVITRTHEYRLGSFVRNCASSQDYNIELRADNVSCVPPVDTDISPITFKNKARPRFVVPDICTGNAVQIANNSCPSRNEMTYEWDFGDGSPVSTQIYPTHSFPTTQATYTVKLKATNSCGTEEYTQTISARRDPIATIRTPGTSIVNNETVVCLANGNVLTLDGNASLGASRHQWKIEGGTYELIQNTTLTSSVVRLTVQPGNSYRITLTALNDCATSSPVTTTVGVVEAPNFIIPHQNSACQPIQYTIPNANPNATYYINGEQFDPVAGKAIGFSSTPYIVTAELESACGMYRPKADTFYVREVLSLRIVSPKDTTVCFGTALIPLVASETWGSWSGEATLLSRQGTQTLMNPKTAGTFTFTYTLGDGECQAEASVTITVSPKPDPAKFAASPPQGCTPLTVAFNPASAERTDIKYRWNFGNTTTSEAYAPSTVFTNTTSVPRRFLVTLVQEGVCGKTQDTLTITVNPQPQAAIGVDSTIVRCAPARYVFSDRSQGKSQSSVWNFGDGSPELTSTADTLSHVFSPRDSLRTYTITLTARNACGTDQATVRIRVSPSTAKPLFTMSESIVCPGTPVRFTDATAPVANRWFWRFGNEGTSSEQNPTFTFQKPETSHTVTLIAYTACGTDSTQKILQTSIRPKANFITDTLVCIGKTVQLRNTTDPVQPGLSGFLWDLGDGTTDSVSVSPTHSYASAGIKNVTLTVYGTPRSCTSLSIEKKITVRQGPKADFRVGDTFCSSVPVQLTNQSVGATSYQWYLNGSPLTTGENPEVSIPAGDHQLSLVASLLSVCSDSLALPQLVHMDSCWVSVPQAFTPDGDGPSTSERITVFGSKVEKIKLFRVKNRWGNTVFENTEFVPNERMLGWNGKDAQGKDMPADLYLYELVFSYANINEPVNKAGTFYLLRNK